MAKTYGRASDYKRQQGVREITLTFDDGPHPTHTPKLLNILGEQEIPAVFFVVGKMINSKKGKQILKRIHEEGHVVGNHTYSHPSLKGKSENVIKKELIRTHDLICEVTGECKLFRPPYGATDATVRKVLTELGYQQVLWSVDTLDWKLKRDGEWVEHALMQIKPREDSIVLMHDIHATTVSNVPRLLDSISSTFRDCWYVCSV